MARHKVKKRSALGLYLGLVALLLVGFLGWKIFRAVSGAVWDGSSRVNLVLITDPIGVVSFDPQEKTLTLVLIPSQTYVEVPHGFSFYRFGAVYDLGELDKRGGTLLMETAQEFLGAPMGGYIKVQSTKDEDIKNTVRQTLGMASVVPVLRGNPAVKTNLTAYDLFRLWWSTRQVRSDKIKALNLDDLGVLENIGLPDGTAIKQADPTALDGKVGKFFAEDKILEENLKIEVLNSTQQVGIGNRVARLIQNMGGEVVNVGSIEAEISQCQIKFNSKVSNDFTLTRLARIFNCQKSETKDRENRSDLTVILGREYAEKLTGRGNSK